MSAIATAYRPVRQLWRRLTSMRTALVLLFLLALAAVPGSLLPQRPLNASKTADYIASHGGWGRFLDHIGAFDVFGSVWFSAIYLLLFVSLVGCLIPRIKVHAKALGRKPLPAPRNLARLPESGSFETSATAEDYAVTARGVLGRRWRVERRTEDGGAVTLSAEKGYSRETGNLVFHVALLAALVLVAVGRLYNYEGQIIVKQGDGFCSSISNYDSFKPGRFAAEGKVAPGPFCINDLTKFTADYTSSGEAREFAAAVTYQKDARTDTPTERATIKVNHPLRLDGDRVYLTGHGYAPQVTITKPDGTVITDTQPFLPTDATTLQSEGAFKEQGVPGKNQDVGVTGTFSPTPVLGLNGLYSSISPQATSPVLGIAVYTGDLNYQGQGQSVYSVDTSKMTMRGAANLFVGQSKTLGTGANKVTVRFDGYVPWVNFQVSHDPAQSYLLVAAVLMVAGLFGSLAIRRRRLWIRLTPSSSDPAGSPTVVTVGGLARSDSGNFTTEFSALLERLRTAGPTGVASQESSDDDPVPAGRE